MIEMDMLFILALAGITVLYALSNLVLLKSNQIIRHRLNKYAFYTVLGIFMAVLLIIFLISNDRIENIIIFLVGVALNPLLIIFPFSTLSEKISLIAKNIISRTLLIIYCFILLIGLLGITSPGNTWGNSGLLQGYIMVLWALPNILLSTLMSFNFRFTGITKIVTGILSLIIIIFTIKETEYTGDLEYFLRFIAFLICVFFMFEGYLFLTKKEIPG